MGQSSSFEQSDTVNQWFYINISLTDNQKYENFKGSLDLWFMLVPMPKKMYWDYYRKVTAHCWKSLPSIKKWFYFG